MSRLVIVGTDSACPLAQQGLTDAVVIAAILPDPPGLVKAESHREPDGDAADDLRDRRGSGLRVEA